MSLLSPRWRAYSRSGAAVGDWSAHQVQDRLPSHGKIHAARQILEHSRMAIAARDGEPSRAIMTARVQPEIESFQTINSPSDHRTEARNSDDWQPTSAGSADLVATGKCAKALGNSRPAHPDKRLTTPEIAGASAKFPAALPVFFLSKIRRAHR